MNKMKLSVVIPAYNEESNLSKTVTDLQEELRAEKIPYELILVNDNSTDSTPEIIKNLMGKDENIKTLNRQPPGGFGRAIRSGLEIITGDAVIICMADSSDDPKDVVKYYKKMEEGFSPKIEPIPLPEEKYDPPLTEMPQKPKSAQVKKKIPPPKPKKKEEPTPEPLKLTKEEIAAELETLKNKLNSIENLRELVESKYKNESYTKAQYDKQMDRLTNDLNRTLTRIKELEMVQKK